jgi:hypothetical protein
MVPVSEWPTKAGGIGARGKLNVSCMSCPFTRRSLHAPHPMWYPASPHWVQIPECKGGLVPDEARYKGVPPVLDPRPVRKEDLGLTAGGRRRILVWLPRFGLGNTLRGYCSAFIFALLSGRRLVRWNGGAHKKASQGLALGSRPGGPGGLPWLDLLCGAPLDGRGPCSGKPGARGGRPGLVCCAE